MDQKTEAQKRIKSLIDRFTENISQYKRTDYDEANTRVDFIDPFFEVLGWDVANKQAYAEQYREVVREAKVIIVGKHKAPDYSFRIGGIRKFFVEAKKPSVDLKKEVSPAFQLRRYAYTAKLPLSILTDFEELSVYDTRIKPTVKDSASVARIFYCGHKEYLKNFDFLYDTFSKEAILKGSFDRYIESTKKKRGTSEVDKEFLKLIDVWREKLAKNIAIRNKQLSLYELNFAVQKIIDRIIFLRIAEDRQIEDYGKLQVLTNGANVYERLRQIFYHSDKRYNSGLFDFKKDRITPGLTIDDKVIKEIIKSVYYPDSPYEFSVFDVQILGNIYEQFLGKTIRLTPAHQVKVEEKPEVKKAGGVYYTLKYIVDYIVKNTVGEIIKKKTPKKLEKIKILDPACGSGSFLLGAYQTLLDYHLNWYSKVGQNKKALKQRKIIPIGKNSFQLTIAEKQRILTNNIFGVDIDRQAVEVSKLSLLLKLLEGETEESTGRLFRYTQLKLLPDLSNNIKCGNSLIGTDYFEGRITGTIDEENLRKINPFDWKKEFPDIFANGGFDAVIGNPPYVRIQGLQEFQPEAVPYLKTKFISASHGSIDIYVIFLEKALQLLNKTGISGYILPHKFFQATMGKNIRKLIAEEKAIKQIVSFGANQIFDNATTYTCLFFMSKKPQLEFLYKKITLGRDIKKKFVIESKLEKIDYKESYKPEWNFYAGKKGELLNKLFKMPQKLGSITRKIFVGLQTSADKIYVLKRLNYKTDDEELIKVFSRSLNQEIGIEREFVKPFLMGKDVKRYEKPVYNNYVIFPYLLRNGIGELMSQKYIKEKFALGWEYLLKNKKDLENREKGRMKGHNFYAYIYPKNLNEFENAKIMTPEISNYPKLTIDKKDNLYHTTTVYSILFNKKALPSENFYLAILNSKLLWFFLKSTGYVLRGEYYRFKTNYLSPFPIPILDINKTKHKLNIRKMVEKVDKMLDLQKKYHSTRLEQDKKLYKNQIDLLDNQIDALVYKLYSLTKEEIKVVEESK